MTQQQLNEIRERCEKATPAPWNYFYKDKYREHHVSIPAYADSGFKMALFPNGCPSTKEDAVFIGNARQDIPALLDYIAELESRLEKAVETPEKIIDFSKLSYAELAVFLEKHGGNS